VALRCVRLLICSLSTLVKIKFDQPRPNQNADLQRIALIAKVVHEIAQVSVRVVRSAHLATAVMSRLEKRARTQCFHILQKCTNPTVATQANHMQKGSIRWNDRPLQSESREATTVTVVTHTRSTSLQITTIALRGAVLTIHATQHHFQHVLQITAV